MKRNKSILRGADGVVPGRPKGRGWKEEGYYEEIERFEVPVQAGKPPRLRVEYQWIHTGWKRYLRGGSIQITL